MENIQNSISNTVSSFTDNPFNLSYSQRLTYLILLYVLSFIFFMVGNFCLPMLAMRWFAICYTLSNISAVAANIIYKGPQGAFDAMFEEKRKIAATIYVASLFLTIYGLCKDCHWIFIMISGFAQILTMFYYTLSGLPFGFDTV